jgi:hypothetical protein
MTRAELAELLAREGFRPDSYHLYGGHGVSECYVLDHTPSGWWNIYYAERGLHNLATFATEAAACAYFLDVLRRDPLTRQS